MKEWRPNRYMMWEYPRSSFNLIINRLRNKTSKSMKYSRYAFLFLILLMTILLAAISTLAYAQETTELCVDFQDWAGREGIEATFTKDGFLFTLPDYYPTFVGPVSGDPILYGLFFVDEEGIQIDFPQPAFQVTIRALSDDLLMITTYNRENDVVDSITSSYTETIRTISLSGAEMVSLRIEGYTDEAYLVDICIEVEEEEPIIGFVDPPQGHRGSVIELNVSGANFEEGSRIFIAEGIEVLETSFISSELLVAFVHITEDAPIGPQPVIVQGPGSSEAVLDGGFTVMPPPTPDGYPDLPTSIIIPTGFAAVALVVTLATRSVMKSRRRQKWQKEAEENLQEPCEPGTKRCQKIESKYDLSQCQIEYLRLTAYNAVSGKLSEEKQIRGKIVDGLNMVIAASRQGEKPEKLKKQIMPLAQALLQSIMDWLYEKRSPQNVSITGHLEGCKVTYKFNLKECKETRTWGEAKEEWEVKIKEERDEPLSVLQRLESSIGISEQLTAELTLRLMQFIEKV